MPRARAVARTLVVLMLGLVGLVLPALPAHAEAEPGATCTSGVLPLGLRLGDGIPLPRQYSNPTSSTVRFRLRIPANRFLGPRREIPATSLPPHTGTTMSAAPVVPTFLHTPLGTGRFTVEVLTDRTGDRVVGSCEYQLTLRAPQPQPVGLLAGLGPWLTQVPLHMCAIEGSALAGAGRPGGTVPAGRLLSTLRAVNDEIWYPAAQVAFSTATDSIPVIADPSPSGGGSGSLGDLEVAFLSNEANRAATACTQAWAELQPGRPGLPVVNARKFINSGAIEGVSPGPATALYVASRNPLSGRRGDDLCGAPQRLTPADIGTPFVVMPDQGFLTRPTLVLAHELGHNLFLGHGNGLDDNGDGTRAGRPGPKRYDEYCDPGWLAPPMNLDVAEDLGTRLVSCEASSSLMNRFASCTNLRPLQTETARGVARLHPGAVDGTEHPVLAPVR